MFQSVWYFKHFHQVLLWGINTTINFLSTFNNCFEIWFLATRYKIKNWIYLIIHKKQKLCGLYTPFLTVKKLIISSKYKFNIHLTCEMAIYHFNMQIFSKLSCFCVCFSVRNLWELHLLFLISYCWKMEKTLLNYKQCMQFFQLSFKWT